MTEKLPADPSQRIGFTPFLTEGRVVFTDVVREIYESVNERFGTDVPAPK